jgi:hypothetical protein
VDAYTQARESFGRLQNIAVAGADDPLRVDYKASVAETLQRDKFEQIISGSDIGQAEASAGAKRQAFETAHGPLGPGTDALKKQLYDSLSPLEKLLPGYKDLGTPLIKLMEQSAAKLKALRSEASSQLAHEQDARVIEAELLFGATSPHTGQARQSDQAFDLLV